MNNNENEVVKVHEFNGIEIYSMKATKFKTSSVNIFFMDDLNEDTATINALLPAVLKRGSMNYPSQKEISLKLEELYGSFFDYGIIKKGEKQITQFYIDYISEKFTLNNETLFDKIFDLIYEVVFNPKITNNGFDEEYLNCEKNNLKDLIESKINDKGHYSIDRCIEEMCFDSPFKLYEFGSVEELEKITNESIYNYYKNVFLKKMPIKIFITGNFSNENIEYIKDKMSKIERGNINKLKNEEIYSKEIISSKDIIEKMNVTQGKLVLGYITNIKPTSDEYISLLMFNLILGGSSHSKLFNIVREKEGLAYDINSIIDKYKGLVLINCGIEIENKDKVLNLINMLFEEIKNGKISDFEYESSIKYIESYLKMLEDSQLKMLDFFINNEILNIKDDVEAMIKKCKNVTKNDIANIVEKIKLDTIYFLTSETNEKEEN